MSPDENPDELEGLPEDLVASLRENDGKLLRAMLEIFRNGKERELYEQLLRDPRLRDLIPH